MRISQLKPVPSGKSAPVVHKSLPVARAIPVVCERAGQLAFKLESSGARVRYCQEDYFLSAELGAIPINLMLKPRLEVRKSLSFFRFLPRDKFAVRALFGIADLGVICLSKEDMIYLQIANKGSKATVLLYEQDVFLNIREVLLAKAGVALTDGYLVSGRNYFEQTFSNCTRTVEELSVRFIHKKHKGWRSRLR